MLDAASTTELITFLMADVGEVIGDTLPIILGILGVLIGLNFAIRFVKRQIGRAQ